MATVISDLVSYLQCGEAISANDAIYIDDVSGKVFKYDVTDDTKVFAGIAKEAGVLDDYIRVVQSGRVKGFSGLTAGAFVYASTTTPGGFQLVEPVASQKIILGIAKSATELVINGGLGIKPGGDGAGGGLDVYYIEDMEGLNDASDFSTGNNAAFLGGGTMQGTLAVDDVSPISGTKSLRYTQAAGSLNDYFASELIDIDLKQQNNSSTLTLYYTYDGDGGDIELIVYDATNSTVLSINQTIQESISASRRYVTVEIPSTCTQIRWGAQVLVENIGAELIVDDVEISVVPKIPLLQAESFHKADSESPCFDKTGAQSLSVKAGTSVAVDGVLVQFSIDTSVILPTLTPGTDYAIYVCSDKSIRASDNFTAPSGYNTTNSRKIGGFHYGLVSPTETVAGGSFATSGSGMIWTQADVDRIKGINEFSIWDVKFRPSCEDPRGMALVSGQFWADIYFTNTNHEVNGTSKAGTDVASGTVLPKIPSEFGGDGSATYPSGTWWNFNEVVRSHGKRFFKYSEFSIAAYGTTEGQSLGGASATIPTTTREPGYTSKYGLEQVSGHQWIWGEDSGFRYNNSTYSWKAETEGRGELYTQGTYGLTYVLLGGDRGLAAGSGSRCSSWFDSPWVSRWLISARAVCDHLKLD